MKTSILFLLGFWTAVAGAIEIDDAAREQLERVASVYKEATGLRARLAVTTEVIVRDVVVCTTNRYDLLADKQGRLRCEIHDGMKESLLISNGTNVWLYVSDKKQYLEGRAPANWLELDDEDEAARFAFSMLSFLQIFLPLWSEDPYGMLMDGVVRASAEGDEDAGGAACHVVSGVQDQFSWRMWIQEQDPALVRRVNMHHLSTNGNRRFEFKLRQEWESQELNPVFEAGSFAFTPPDGVEKVETFLSSRRQAPAPPNALLGKPAPEVSLPLLEGGSVELASHRGKEVVVLDFWASWCPPCRRSLPVLKAVAERWASSNVVFYAVNREEDPDKIQAFMEKQPIGLPVVLDDGALAEAFEVSAIPHLLIVDKAGVVQHIHVGFSSALEKELGSLLARILAGEAVAEQTLKEWEAQKTNAPPADTAYKGKPIPCGPEAFTIRDYRKLNAEFVRRTFTGHYLDTRENAEGEDEILPYLAEYERYVVGSDDPVATDQEMVDGARALLKKGYDHPVIHYCLGAACRTLKTDAAYEESTKEMELCYKLFSTPRYDSSWRRYRCAVRLLWNLRDLRQHTKQKTSYARIQQDALKALKEVFTDGTFSNINLRIPMDELREMLRSCSTTVLPREDYVAVLDSIQDQIHPALYHYARSMGAYSQGWAARGGGFASTVKEDKWETFHTCMDQAREHAEKAWEAFPCPEIAAHFIQIARSRAKEPNEWRKWFDEAAALQMDYDDAYDALEFTLYPRWHGSHREMLKFGEECLATRRFDTVVPSRYEEAVRNISSESDDPLAVFRKPGVYSNLLAVFDGYLAQDPDIESKQKDILSRKVIAAWASEHYDDAARYLAELAGPLAQNPLDWYDLHEPTIRGEVAVFTGPRSKAFAEARKWAATGQKDKARDALAELLKEPGLDAGERYSIEDAHEVLRVGKEFATGETVALLPPPNLAGWAPETDQWQVREDGTLFSLLQEQGPMTDIRMKAELGNYFELSGDVELRGVESSGALLIGWPLLGGHKDVRISFNRWRQKISISQNSKNEVEMQIPLTQLNRFLLRFEGQKMTLIVNERVVAENKELPEDWFRYQDEHTTIGFRNATRNAKMSMGVRELSVRKLEKP